MAGLYIHIPFCKKACHYCNFHFSTSLKNRKKIISSMIKEIEIKSIGNVNQPTVPPLDLAKLQSSVHSSPAEDKIGSVGLTAAVFTTIAFVPQVLKIWKKRDASGVSITMYVIMFIGICIWFCYGILIDSISVITANGVSGILQMFIIAFALIHRKKN